MKGGQHRSSAIGRAARRRGTLSEAPAVETSDDTPVSGSLAWWRTWTVGVGALVALKLVVTLALAGRWGYHRDEPYYIVGGRNLDWGFVDHPPLTPALAGLADTLSGSSLAMFRVLPALVSASLLIIAAATARRLGGSGRAAIVAALATFACPLFLVTGHWFQTVPFDQLLGALAILVWAHLLAGGNIRWWVPLGVIIGVGLENKWTMLLVVAAIVLGTLTSARLRPQMRSPWPWVGATGALLLWVPNLLWQVDQGWPTLDFIQDNSAAVREEDGRGVFLLDQPGILGLPLLVLVAVGLVWCWRRVAWRPATIALGTALIALTMVGAKAYYHGPFLPFLFAAGAVAVDSWVGRARHLLVGSVAVWGLVAVPITLPLLAPSRADDVGVFGVNDEMAEELGWPELVDQVAATLAGLPDSERADARIITTSYGEAAAIELLGPDRGIPEGTAVSGHNNYVTWWPDGVPEGTVVTVRFRPDDLADLFDSCEIVDEVRNKYGIENEVAEAPIMVCRDPTVQPGELRESLRHTG